MTSSDPDGYAPNSLMALLGPEARAALARVWRVERAAPHALVVAAGEEGGELGILLSGAARATAYTQRGREITFQDLAPGECFGEFSAIDGGMRSASVTAIEPARIAWLSRARFETLLTEHPEIALVFLRLLVGKLRGLSARVEELGSRRADQRVRAELVRLARAHRTGADRAEIPRLPTHSDIAARVLTNRETVSKELGRLRALGLVEGKGRALRVPSIARLEASVETLGPEPRPRRGRG